MSAYISSGTRSRRSRISEAADVLRQFADAGDQTSKQETSKRSARR